MELRCSVCKRKIDVESEVVAVFECYVYCEKCIMEMEKKQPIHSWDQAGEESADEIPC